jgi:hypothetical protein
MVMAPHPFMHSPHLRDELEQKALPPFLSRVLTEFGLMMAFQSLPADDQAKYVSWIESPGRKTIEDRRVARLLDELAQSEAFRRRL